MPVYEYACIECGHHFERYHKVTDRPPRRCPECRARVRKVFRPVGIIFKGSGFHVTDYRKPDGKPTGEPKKQPASTGSSKDKKSD